MLLVKSLLLLLLLVLFVAATTTLVTAITITGPQPCYNDNTTLGLMLPPEQYEGYGMCPPGFYCPYANPADQYTWPRLCPPSLECVASREERVFCNPQGPYEPIPCKPGHYCPTAKEMYPCEEGYWCPPASTFQRKCGPLSLCAAESTREIDLSGLLFILLLDIFCITGVFIRSKYRRKQLTESNEEAQKNPKPESWDALSLEDQETFIDGIRKRRGGMSPMTFRFNKLRVAIPASEVKRAKSGGGDGGKSKKQLDAAAEDGGMMRQQPQQVELEKEEEDMKVLPRRDVGASSSEFINNNERSQEDKEEETVLLSGLTGRLKPGRVTAVMGPSGAGKTVFLSTILGKADAAWKCSGTMTINNSRSTNENNGNNSSKNDAAATISTTTAPPSPSQSLPVVQEHVDEYKHFIGYVPQDDILHSELSVYDNIWYSSEVRLPSSWTPEEREEYRDVVLSTLGLQSVKHVRVGDEESRGVSGGQRKRVSVAMELASAPLAAFLDEPTTGLDATTALQLCRALKSVAMATDMTVAMVVHQPRVEIWKELDEVLFIGPGGRTVYQGPQKGAATYFAQTIGLDFTKGNPADIIIDGIDAFPEECVAKWSEVCSDPDHLPEYLQISAITGGGGGSPLMDVRHTRTAFETAEEHLNKKPTPFDGAWFGRQVFLFHTRSTQKQQVHLFTIFLDIGLGVIYAAAMGAAAVDEQSVMFLRAPYTLLSVKPTFYIVPMLSMFYLIAIAASASASAIRAFGGEQVQYWREAGTGALIKPAYYIGTTTAEIYRLVLTALHFSFIAYIMWMPYQTFWRLFFIILLMFFSVDSQASMLGMAIRPRNAPLLTTVMGVFTSLLNGFAGIPVVGVVAYSWYTTEAILTDFLEFVDHLYMYKPVEEFFGYTAFRWGTDVLAVCCIIIVYRLIGFTLMVILNRNKQK